MDTNALIAKIRDLHGKTDTDWGQLYALAYVAGEALAQQQEEINALNRENIRLGAIARASKDFFRKRSIEVSDLLVKIDHALSLIDLDYLEYKPHKAVDAIRSVHAALKKDATDD